MDNSQTDNRACGECTSCCDGWLHAVIYGHEMGNGVPCQFRKPAACGIYDTRPELCRSFRCGWLMPGSGFPEAWRPDKAGFIIRPGTWRGGKCWLLHPAPQDPGEEVLAFMRQHTIATGEPHIIVKKGSWLCYGKPEFQQAMVEFRRTEHPGAELKVNFLQKS